MGCGEPEPCTCSLTESEALHETCGGGVVKVDKYEEGSKDLVQTLAYGFLGGGGNSLICSASGLSIRCLAFASPI